MNENEKIIAYYAIDALMQTLKEDEEKEIYYNSQDYTVDLTDIKKIGSLKEIEKIADELLNKLCN